MIQQSKCPCLNSDCVGDGEPTMVHMVMRPGSKVRLGPSEQDSIEAIVNKVCLEAEQISYEVIWWRGNDRKSAWVYQHELVGMNFERSAILGFAP